MYNVLLCDVAGSVNLDLYLQPRSSSNSESVSEYISEFKSGTRYKKGSSSKDVLCSKIESVSASFSMQKTSLELEGNGDIFLVTNVCSSSESKFVKAASKTSLCETHRINMQHKGTTRWIALKWHHLLNAPWYNWSCRSWWRQATSYSCRIPSIDCFSTVASASVVPQHSEKAACTAKSAQNKLGNTHQKTRITDSRTRSTDSRTRSPVQSGFNQKRKASVQSSSKKQEVSSKKAKIGNPLVSMQNKKQNVPPEKGRLIQSCLHGLHQMGEPVYSNTSIDTLSRASSWDCLFDLS